MGALIPPPLLAEGSVVTDPLTAAPVIEDVDPPAAPADVPAENEELEGSVDVGTLSGSVPVLVVV